MINAMCKMHVCPVNGQFLELRVWVVVSSNQSEAVCYTSSLVTRLLPQKEPGNETSYTSSLGSVL